MEQSGAVNVERKSLVERALSIFAEVRAGESTGLLLLALNGFLLLTAYYLVRPVRDALTLAEGGSRGAEIKSYLSAGQALLLLAVRQWTG